MNLKVKIEELERKIDRLSETLFRLKNQQPATITALIHEKVILELKEAQAMAESIETEGTERL